MVRRPTNGGFWSRPQFRTMKNQSWTSPAEIFFIWFDFKIEVSCNSRESLSCLRRHERCVKHWRNAWNFFENDDFWISVNLDVMISVLKIAPGWRHEVHSAQQTALILNTLPREVPGRDKCSKKIEWIENGKFYENPQKNRELSLRATFYIMHRMRSHLSS